MDRWMVGWNGQGRARSADSNLANFVHEFAKGVGVLNVLRSTFGIDPHFGVDKQRRCIVGLSFDESDFNFAG